MSVRRSRRSFLTSTALGAAALALPLRSSTAAARSMLQAGEGVVDTTPPIGIELGGFHRKPGEERRIAGIRRPTAARALVLQLGDTQAALVSIDIATVVAEMTARVQQRIASELGIPAANVRLCASHTHSMPAFCYLRQWGAVSPEYMAAVEDKIFRAVQLAQADLAPTKVGIGKGHAPGASNNRTLPKGQKCKTDEQFTKESTDDERWLDTQVQVLHFERAADKRDLLWYHFTAHPVCFQDEQAGPDWPGMVEDLIRERLNLSPSFLQGHCGDVNAGDENHWIGSMENTAKPVADAIAHAMDNIRPVAADTLRVATQQFPVPLDIELFRQWLDQYRSDPSKCQDGVWVDPPFAEDWYKASSSRDLSQKHLPAPLSVMQLGDVGLVFHPGELYSVYGLTIQRDAPLTNTLVVGYTDHIIGYLPDPNAYKAAEYSAITVPKILDYPPFVPTAARELTAAAVDMLKQLVG